MPVNWVTYTSYVRERDMLSILMDSNLYFELSLQERRILLNRIVESYHSTALSSQATPCEPELDPLVSLQSRSGRNAKYFS